MTIKSEKKFNKNDPDWVPRKHAPIKCKHCGVNSFYVTDACWLCHNPLEKKKENKED